MKTAGNSKILYIDCLAGISGDMFLSAMHDLCEASGVNADEIEEAIHEIARTLKNVNKVEIQFEKTRKNGFVSTYMKLSIDESIGHHGSGAEAVSHNLRECLEQISFTVPSLVEAFVFSVFNILVSAEKRAHGIVDDGPSEHHVHLHELSSADTIIDILGAAKALDMLGFFEHGDRFKVVSRPLSVGSGEITIAHGVVSVPAPATANILEKHGIPFTVGPVEGFELATPTGCAILAALHPSFEAFREPTRVVACGLGSGTKEFEEIANILKIMLLEEFHEDPETRGLAKMVQGEAADGVLRFDKIVQLTVTIDDQSPEDVGYLIEKTYDLGAKEVYVMPAHMKKSRTGVEITILCRLQEYVPVCMAWLKESTTLGCRFQVLHRIKIEREVKNVHVEIKAGDKKFSGDVRVKYIPREFIKTPTGSIFRPEYKIEYDDLKVVANALGTSMHEARHLVKSQLE